MPKSMYVLWACYAVMFLMSPIGALIVQYLTDRDEGKK